MSTSVNGNELNRTEAGTPHIRYSTSAGSLSAPMQMIADGLGDGLLIAVLTAIALVCLVLGAPYFSSLAGLVLEDFGQFFVG